MNVDRFEALLVHQPPLSGGDQVLFAQACKAGDFALASIVVFRRPENRPSDFEYPDIEYILEKFEHR